MRLRLSTFLCTILVGAVAAGQSGNSYGQHKSDPKELVAAPKRSLAQSKQSLPEYEWDETTSVSLTGEETSRMTGPKVRCRKWRSEVAPPSTRRQNRCYWATPWCY